MKNFCLVLLMCLLISLLPTHQAQAITFTPTPTQTVKVIVRLLDANNQPLAGVTVNVVLNRYGDTIEEIQAGICVTDATGSCSITVDDPPRLRSGKIEGFIDLGTYGRQLIGWKGDTFEIALQLYPDGKLATVPAPLDAPYEGQTEQPTDAPLSTGIPVITYTPTSTSYSTRVASPSIPPTATVTASATSTLTLQPTITSTSILPTPVSPSDSSHRASVVLIGLGLVLIAGLFAAFAIMFHCQRKARQSDEAE